MKVSPYLTFSGNAKEAFEFYKTIFGGELHTITFNDMPGADKMLEKDRNKVMHTSLAFGDNLIMASDFMPQPGNQESLSFGNNFAMSINPSSKEEADSLFAKLSKGGRIIMPIADTFWNAYFGILIDKFSIKWMINFEYKK